MTDRPTCATCVSFHRGAPELASGTRLPDGSNPDLGTCNLAPPELVRSTVGAMSMRPATLATALCCEAYVAVDGPDDGERDDLPCDTVIHFDRKAAA